jgi:hypothetical protein
MCTGAAGERGKRTQLPDVMPAAIVPDVRTLAESRDPRPARHVCNRHSKSGIILQLSSTARARRLHRRCISGDPTGCAGPGTATHFGFYWSGGFAGGAAPHVHGMGSRRQQACLVRPSNAKCFIKRHAPTARQTARRTCRGSDSEAFIWWELIWRRARRMPVAEDGVMCHAVM